MTTTRPDHPRPEVVALAEAMLSADPDYQFAAEMILRHLPAPFAIVDMDALVAELSESPLPGARYAVTVVKRYRAEARRLLGGGRT